MEPSNMLDSPRYDLILYGPLRMLRPGGADATPKSVKSQAILAMLGIAGGEPIERSTLQDHLWSNRMQKQGRDSLRQALSDLRSALGLDAHEILITDAGRVSLNMSRIRCHLKAPDSGAALHVPGFLEGLEVRDPVFEEWLCITRSRLEPGTNPARAPAGAGERSTVMGADNPDSHQSRGNDGSSGVVPEMPSTAFSVEIHAPSANDATAMLVCDAILDDVATNLNDLYGADIFDLRDPADIVPPRHIEGPALGLQIGAVQDERHMRLQIRVKETGSRRLIWSHSAVLSRENSLERSDPSRSSLISHITERMISALRSSDRVVRLPGGPYQALTLMFRSEDEAGRKVADFLTSVRDMSNDPVYRALAAYQETLFVGESNSIASQETKERVSGLIRRSLDAGKFDSTYLSTAGYALHYLTNENELSADLLARSVEAGPCQAICWDHLALFHFNNGDFRRAREASLRALALGSQSQFRFAYETTRAMIAHAEGDHPTAILFGRYALERRPGFSAALRYTIASLALSGKMDEATRYANLMLKQFPDFRATQPTQGLVTAASRTVGKQLKKGLLLAGIPL